MATTIAYFFTSNYIIIGPIVEYTTFYGALHLIRSSAMASAFLTRCIYSLVRRIFIAPVLLLPPMGFDIFHAHLKLIAWDTADPHSNAAQQFIINYWNAKMNNFSFLQLGATQKLHTKHHTR